MEAIPNEVPTKRLLLSIGAPPARLADLVAGDRPLLMAAAQPDVRWEAELRVRRQLQWAIDAGARLDAKGRPPANLGQDGGGQSSGGSGGEGREGRGTGGTGAGGGGVTASSQQLKSTKSKRMSRRSVACKMEAAVDASARESMEPAKMMRFEDVVEATRHWADDLKIGEGGSAVVYKGYGPEGELWAVKRSKKGGLSRDKDFEKEVEMMSRMYHPNLVRLLGYSVEENEQVRGGNSTPCRNRIGELNCRVG